MRKRHLGHRAEIRAGADKNLKNENVFEFEVMKHFNLTIIALRRLDQLEGDFQKRLMCMDYNGGMNRRDETVRRRRGS